MNANSLLEAPSFRVGNPQFTESIENELDPDDEDPVCPIKCDLRQNPQQEHDAAIRNEVLDEIVEFTRGNSETIEAYDSTLEDAVFLGDLLAKIESLRGTKERDQK